VFTDATATNLPVDLFKQQDADMLDFDGDLDVDLAITGKGGVTRVYLNDGAGSFSSITVGNTVGSTGTYEVDWGDLDGDGDFDSAVQSMTSSNEGWARNNGIASAMTETTFGTLNQDDNEMACIDYDVDGDLDIFVGSLGASERFYTNTGAVFSLGSGVVQAQSDSSLDAGFGDLDGDGRYDLVTGQGESGNFTNKVYMNSGAIDTLAPVYVQVETPAAVGASSTVFRVQLSDQYSDDGHIPVTVTYSWTTIGAGSGSDTAHRMGLGLYRAEVPTAGASSVSLTWTATDDAGNVSVNGPIVVGGPPSPFEDLGGGLAGGSGIPVLAGTGTLVVGSPGSLDLSNALPSALAILYVSFANTPTPFKGGTLSAIPIQLEVVVGTSFSGAIALPWAAWPSGIPVGFELFFQFVIEDAGAIKGAAISNLLKATQP